MIHFYCFQQREQFPDLVPRGGNTRYADASGGRALKQSIAPHRSSGQVWERVARVATSSTLISSSGGSSTQRLPAKPASSAMSASANSGQPLFRQSQRSTPWTSSGASASSTPQRNNFQAPNRPSSSILGLSSTAFPSLPAAAPRAKPRMGGNQSLRNIIGNNRPPSNAWSTDTGDQETSETRDSSEDANTQSKKGRKKGKEKITLFTLGSFPT